MLRQLLLSLALFTASALAATPPKDKQPDNRGPNGEAVRKYTKEWTDDFRGFHKEVYTAYSKRLKDDTGTEHSVEIWHGPAADHHKNGTKAWEAIYRNGLREGEFTSWGDDGTKTGSATFRAGRMHGQYTQWNKKGQKMREETYADGKLDGVSSWWNADGLLVSKGTYRAGAPWEGAFAEGENAKPRWVIRTYADGKITGEQAMTGNWWW